MFINCSRFNEGDIDYNSEKVRQYRLSEGEILRLNPVIANITEWKAEKRKLRTNSRWEKLRQ